MEKHEWRKSEKEIYLPKTVPGVIDVPAFKFITVAGEGNPNSPEFADYIGVLYSVSYAVKMTLKKLGSKPAGYTDYTVYPLEGVWDLNEKGRQEYNGTINKNDLVFKLMIRQPDFVNDSFFGEMLELTKKNKPHDLLEHVRFENITEGKCVQMMHIGSYDDEPESFEQMETFAESRNLIRDSKIHREIYISDFRKTVPEKLKTVLRFMVKT